MTRPHTFAPDEDGHCSECPLPRAHPAHGPSLPETPYAGSSGWSGSDTSRERADREDGGGATSERQRSVLQLLDYWGEVGATWKQVAEAEGWHHGQASGALSTLHKTGRIARLTERRDRCAVYVLPEYVNDRETRPQGRGGTDDVVKREEFRVTGMTRAEGFRDATTTPYTDRAAAELMARKRGGRVQIRTVIETPWEDA